MLREHVRPNWTWKFGHYLNVEAPYFNGFESVTPGWDVNPYGAIHDPVINALRRSCIPGEDVPLSTLFDSYWENPLTSLEIQHGTHVEPRSSLPTGVSQTILNNIKELLSGWNFQPKHLNPTFLRYAAREHDGQHLDWVGDVRHNNGDRYPTSPIEGDWPTNWSGFWASSYIQQKIRLHTDGAGRILSYNSTGLLGNAIHDLFHASTRPVCQSLSDLRALVSESEPITQGDFGPAYVKTFLTSLTYSFNLDGSISSIEYSVRNELTTWSSSYNYRIHFGYVITPSIMFIDGVWPTDGMIYDLNDRDLIQGYMGYTVQVKSEYISKHPDEYGPTSWTENSEIISSGNYFGSYDLSSFIFGDDTIGGVPGFAYVKNCDPGNGFYSPFTAHYSIVSVDHKFVFWRQNLRGLTAVSGSKAVENAMLAVDDNYIETLSELKDLRKLLDPIRTAFLLYRQIKSGEVFNASFTFLDLLGNAYLVYKFGLAPNIRSAKDVVKKFAPIVRNLRTLKWNFPLKGHGHSNVLDVPYDIDVCPYLGVTARAHTIAEFRYTDSTIMSALMPAKFLGVLPTLANMWDLVPWSFFVDYFTGISNKLDVIDGQLQGVALDVVGFTSTLTVNIPFSEDILTSAGLVSVDPRHPTSVRFYERIVEPQLPSMYPSRYDFLPPVGFTDWKLGSALMWTTISGAL